MSTAGAADSGRTMKLNGRMRSARGFWGALVLLATLPLAAVYQMFLANGFETFLHWVLATGTLLVALGALDFDRLPRSLNWIGCLLAGAEAVIFFLQGLSHLIQNAAFTHFAYDLLGQGLEAWLPRLLIIIWFGALLLRDSHGWTRIFGFFALLVFLVAEAVRISSTAQGTPAPEVLKAVILLPFLWLLLESRKGMTRS